MRSRVRITVVAWAVVGFGVAGIGYGMDCHGKVVSAGASARDVQALCSDSAQVNDTVEVVLKPVYDPSGYDVGRVPVAV